jgi:hypothetical protein
MFSTQNKFPSEMFCILHILLIFAGRDLTTLKNGNISKKAPQQDADSEP